MTDTGQQVAEIEQWTWATPREGLTLGQLLDKLIAQGTPVTQVNVEGNALLITHSKETF